MTTFEPRLIDTSEHDELMHAELCSPPMNGFGAGLVTALSELVDRFEHGRAKVLLLSSAIPGYFADSEDTPVAALSSEQRADYHDSVRATLERLAACRRPSIAAIDGRAVGLGLELALACTLRFCSPRSRLGIPGVRLGSVPAAGGTQRLPSLIGPGQALDLMLTGRLVTGDEALRIGLVERLFYRDVVREAQAVATSLAATSSPAMGLIIGCVEAAADLPHEQGMSVERAALLSTIEDGRGS